MSEEIIERAAKAIEVATGYSGDIARKQARAALEAARWGEMRDMLEQFCKAAELDADPAYAHLIMDARALLSTIGAA